MKILFFAASYLLGAVPAGYIVYRLKEKKDIRTLGSRNIGATNILRLSSWKLALPVICFDIAKGIIPPLVALKYFSNLQPALICGALAILGHCFPVYIQFRGGKGVATALGVYSVIGLKPLVLSLIVFIFIVALLRFVSVGSMMATVAFPLFAIILGNSMQIVILGIFVFSLIAFQHRENIKRLISGRERKLGEKA